MTDVVITPASVIAGSNAHIETGVAGETLTAGQVVYKEAASGKYKLADNNSATAEVRSATGIALTGSALNQPVIVAKSGPVAFGAVLTAATAYYLGDAPGAICPVGDLAAGEYPALLGMATSTSELRLDIQAPVGPL